MLPEYVGRIEFVRTFNRNAFIRNAGKGFTYRMHLIAAGMLTPERFVEKAKPARSLCACREVWHEGNCPNRGRCDACGLLCGAEHAPASSCASHYVTIPNNPDDAEAGCVDYLRVKHPEKSRGSCVTCGVVPGGFHHRGCIEERCPKCRGQRLSCACDPPGSEAEAHGILFSDAAGWS